MKVIELTENPITAFLICFLLLVSLGFVNKEYWLFLFSVVSAYLVSDIVINLFIAGGRGIAHIPITGSHSQEKGQAYLAFFIGIIASTIISNYFSDAILAVINSYNDWTYALAAASLFLSLAVYVDMKAKFYKRST
jgi:hypothetical protein